MPRRRRQAKTPKAREAPDWSLSSQFAIPAYDAKQDKNVPLYEGKRPRSAYSRVASGPLGAVPKGIRVRGPKPRAPTGALTEPAVGSGASAVSRLRDSSPALLTPYLASPGFGPSPGITYEGGLSGSVAEGDSVVADAPTPASASDMEVVRAVLLRESYLEVLLQMIPSMRTSIAQPKNLSNLVWLLREVTVEVVEAVSRWRMAIQSPQPFMYKGENYILKLVHDLDELNNVPLFVQWLGYDAYKNPFLTPQALNAVNEPRRVGAPAHVGGVDALRLRAVERVVLAEVETYSWNNSLPPSDPSGAPESALWEAASTLMSVGTADNGEEEEEEVEGGGDAPVAAARPQSAAVARSRPKSGKARPQSAAPVRSRPPKPKPTPAAAPATDAWPTPLKTPPREERDERQEREEILSPAERRELVELTAYEGGRGSRLSHMIKDLAKSRTQIAVIEGDVELMRDQLEQLADDQGPLAVAERQTLRDEVGQAETELYHRRLEAARKEQVHATYRSSLQSKRDRVLAAQLEELRQIAANVIQRNARMWIAMGTLSRKREQREAAVAIQRVVRGSKGRKSARRRNSAARRAKITAQEEERRRHLELAAFRAKSELQRVKQEYSRQAVELRRLEQRREMQERLGMSDEDAYSAALRFLATNETVDELQAAATGLRLALDEAAPPSVGSVLLQATADPDVVEEPEWEEGRVPLSSLSASEVARVLRRLGMSAYTRAFKQLRVDGVMLEEVTEEDLSRDLQVSVRLHRTKLLRFVEESLERGVVVPPLSPEDEEPEEPEEPEETDKAQEPEQAQAQEPEPEDGGLRAAVAAMVPQQLAQLIRQCDSEALSLSELKTVIRDTIGVRLSVAHLKSIYRRLDPSQSGLAEGSDFLALFGIGEADILDALNQVGSPRSAAAIAKAAAEEEERAAAEKQRIDAAVRLAEQKLADAIMAEAQAREAVANEARERVAAEEAARAAAERERLAHAAAEQEARERQVLEAASAEAARAEAAAAESRAQQIAARAQAEDAIEEKEKAAKRAEKLLRMMGMTDADVQAAIQAMERGEEGAGDGAMAVQQLQMAEKAADVAKAAVERVSYEDRNLQTRQREAEAKARAAEEAEAVALEAAEREREEREALRVAAEQAEATRRRAEEAAARRAEASARAEAAQREQDAAAARAAEEEAQRGEAIQPDLPPPDEQAERARQVARLARETAQREEEERRQLLERAAHDLQVRQQEAQQAAADLGPVAPSVAGTHKEEEGEEEEAGAEEDEEAAVMVPMPGTQRHFSGWYRVPNTTVMAHFIVSPHGEWLPTVNPMEIEYWKAYAEMARESDFLVACPGTTQGASGFYLDRNGAITNWLVSAASGEWAQVLLEEGAHRAVTEGPAVTGTPTEAVAVPQTAPAASASPSSAASASMPVPHEQALSTSVDVDPTVSLEEQLRVRERVAAELARATVREVLAAVAPAPVVEPLPVTVAPSAEKTEEKAKPRPRHRPKSAKVRVPVAYEGDLITPEQAAVFIGDDRAQRLDQDDLSVMSDLLAPSASSGGGPSFLDILDSERHDDQDDVLVLQQPSPASPAPAPMPRPMALNTALDSVADGQTSPMSASFRARP